MSYNLKCCSFYPNNFDASALISVGVRMYLGRSTHVPRSEYDDLTVPFAQLSASFQATIKPSRTASLRGFKRQ